jgi:hypothetical protein
MTIEAEKERTPKGGGRRHSGSFSNTEALTNARAVECIEQPIFRRSCPERSISISRYFRSISGGVSFICSSPLPYSQIS